VYYTTRVDRKLPIPYTDDMEHVFALVDISQEFTPASHFKSLGDLISVVIPNVFVLAGIITFILLVFGGFGIIVGAGSGDSKKLEEGQKAITGAIIGLIVVVGSIWILQNIETLTGMSGKLLPMK
jgi:hypothetical protein